ncbi:RWD domain-containing protein 2A [Aethina tumida]|uniref:RWD domain-containing protein 2A n=1 Tax=Aethina tumida TaxID=116153 RepID=UPI00096B4E86|nr:RWD domain-containing protein 2A [Aethina tumida]XP_019876145.1 RWD domain-containing protein 2A [Aethina tumida]
MPTEVLSPEKIRDNLQVQLDELESLQSMFCNPGELKVDFPSFYEIKEYLEGNMSAPGGHLDYTINIDIDKFKFEICVNLPLEYPDVTPEMFIRNSKLNKVQHIAINKEISNFLNSLDRGEPCIFTAVSWLQDNYEKYIQIQEDPKPSQTQKNEDLVRYWIYAHHIYSKTKRREIVDQAHNYSLNGFCLSGKPGIICVEGTVDDCDAWWQIIKSMNWKKIFRKCTEEDKEKGNNFLKFSSFTEISFPTGGSLPNHSDMGEFNKYLDKQGLGYMFKDIFGLEG